MEYKQSIKVLSTLNSSLVQVSGKYKIIVFVTLWNSARESLHLIVTAIFQHM